MTATMADVGLRTSGILGDLVRGAAAVGAVVCAAIGQWDDAARFLIVFLVLLASRLTRLPRPFDAALGVTLTMATVAMPAGWYETVPWADWVIHGTATGATAAATAIALTRTGWLPPLRSPALTRRRPALVGLVVALGWSVGVVWEFWEWLATQVFGMVMVVGYTDTIADLAMDGLGALVAGIALAVWAGSGHSSYRGSEA